MQMSDDVIVGTDSTGAIVELDNAGARGAGSIEMSHPFSIPEATPAHSDALAIPVVHDEAVPVFSDVDQTPHTVHSAFMLVF
jgi:hypothetical protein